MKKGFTLAEVLITLGIIGVIAALTVPGLIGDTATRQNVTKFRKAHTVLSQALATQMALTNTNVNTRNTTDFANLSDYFSVNMNASDITGNIVTTVDGMTFTFVNGTCTQARSGSTINVGDESPCYVTVDVDGPNNGANSYLTPTSGAPIIRDQFVLEVYDTAVAAQDGTVEEFLLEGGNDLSKSTATTNASSRS